MYILGIDGGGTKTTGVITDINGKIIAIHTVGGTNQNGSNKEAIKQKMKELLMELKKQKKEAYSKLAVVFAGMSGVESLEGKQLIEQSIYKHISTSIPLIVDNDGVNALYSGTLGEPGIVQIAGTGSITFGINANGERGRVGGWGYLLDDDGSGYALGREALMAVYRYYDGYGEQTLLTKFFLEYFQTDTPKEMIPSIYQQGKARDIIAPLSKLVVAAADKNDAVAKKIVDKSSLNMGNSVLALINNLFYDQKQKDPIKIILAGGVFNRADLFIPSLKKHLDAANVQTELIVPEMPPIAGAVIAGLKQLRIPIDNSLVNEWKHLLYPV
ncbi:MULTISPECIES: N-acetylglucosamine kinase [unclassified Bacillus (in: firmicutes)]|uniref:N-acetylglucosamine kinase n=1 Tax=unclassified Bacillus (in: firmicutes) TaxID=185979 RepID=UPI0004E21D66|nr:MULTISPECIES: BadF/BadG/BcrA/BcrD ATPase family protein [unclassified Bacillus (in: firmicutes)]